MAFLGTFAATGKSTSRRSAKHPLAPEREISQLKSFCRFYVISAMARATVEAEALFAVGTSGSGAGGKSVRHTARYGICSVTAWYILAHS